MERPWWMFAFLLPLCCGSTFVVMLVGVGGGGLMGGLFFSGVAATPWGALFSGGLMGAMFAVPLIVAADKSLRTRRSRSCGPDTDAS